ncbi:hypothetical protein M9458_007986, partial [Cirrhinus mrigala]
LERSPICVVCPGVLRAGNDVRAGQRHHQLSVLDWVQLQPPCVPPRHHRTELEGRDPQVSEECPAPIQNQPTGPPAHPEPSQPTPRLTEPEPEPTMDGEPEPRVTEPLPMGVTVREITTEPEPIESDQVREPAAMPATVDVPVGREGAEDSTAHCTAADG